MIDWDRMVNEHGPMVFATAWRILGHAADTEDVCQEVFLEAHRLRQSLPVRRWAGLLRRLATFRALDRLRQRKSMLSLENVTLTDTASGPAETLIGRELASRLRQAVATLPEREASVFCLRYFEDLSYQQIATVQNTTPAAVATALHKARAKLETLLAEVIQGD